MAGMGSSTQRSKDHPTRRPLRAVLVAVILAATAGVVWAGVLRSEQSSGSCQVAAEASGAMGGAQRLDSDGLDEVSPAPPEQVRVQVLNANGMRGVAAIAGGRLSELGFAPTGSPANDPLHPGFDLACHGEIRFGPAGQAAARTLSLVMPCAELVRDARPDATVDLALGTEFTALRPNAAARAALRSMSQPAPAAPSSSGQAAQLTPPVVPQHLLDQARQVTC